MGNVVEKSSTETIHPFAFLAWHADVHSILG